MDSETKLTPKTVNVEPTNSDTNALDALKQDPAILDAHIKVDTSKIGRSFSDPNVSKHGAEKQKTANSDDGGKKEMPSTREFEEMINMHKAALLSLAPDKLDLLLSYAGLLRMQRHNQQKPGSQECALCKKNGKPTSWYTTHVLKDSRGRVRCPVLREYRCPVCGATGDRAHTIKYCPENQYRDRWSR